MLKDFKEFAVKGNVMDLAVGVIIGASFGRVVSSVVSDIIMPPIGLALGKVDFSSLYVNLSDKVYPSYAEAKKAGAPVIGYGSFLNTIVEFLIIAFVVFVIVRMFNKLRREEAPAAITTKECAFCCSAIPIPATRCPNCTSQF